MAHSIKGASKRGLWGKGRCPGAIREIAKAPKRPAGPEAAKGSDYHDRCEKKLHEWLANGRSGKILSAIDPGELYPYLRHVANLAGSEGEVLVEYSVQGLKAYDPDLWGMLDAGIRSGFYADPETGDIKPAGCEVTHVVDLKTGQGIQVEVEDEHGLNPQLEEYGIALLLEKPTPWLQLHIVQPFGAEERGLKVIRSSQLIECKHAFEVLLPALLEESRLVSEMMDKPGEGLNPGPWCSNYFCDARVQCPAIIAELKETENPFVPLAHPQSDLATVDENARRPTALADLKEKAELARAWANEADKFVLAEAEAGQPVEGWTLEQGMGNRKWREASKEASVIRACGIPKKRCIVTKLKSPTQLQKEVDDPERWAKIERKHVVREPTSKRLVRAKPGAPPPSPVFDAVETNTETETKPIDFAALLA